MVADCAIITAHTWDWLSHGTSVHIGILPLYHIFGSPLFATLPSRIASRNEPAGLNNLLHHAPSRGVPVVILARFEPVPFLRAVERYGATAAMVVPPILLALLQHPGARPAPASARPRARPLIARAQRRTSTTCAR